MTITHDDLLVEIGTEELPPKSLYRLASCFAEKLEQEMMKAEFKFESVHFFATPRRLAVWIRNLHEYQPNRVIEKTGPSITQAYDAEGNPTPAALGFAKSCQVTMSALQSKETPKGTCLYFKQDVPGESIFKLAPFFIKNALNQLPIPKPMLWGNHSASFIRPVHWLLLMYGKDIIPCHLFDLDADNKTYGHRFHHPQQISILKPQDFQTQLKDSYVISDFDQRKASIRNQVTRLAETKGRVILDEDLLDEVTGLVEWPVALLGSFDNRFLKVPQEALISAMKLHQKCFPVINNEGNLLPYFITIANIESKQPEEVVIGNERVIRARLTDAEFFYQTDLKNGIEKNLEQLKNIIFQIKLGTLYQKAQRISELSGFLAAKLNDDETLSKRAGLLCKADLTTEMVGEFPELQGIMGHYYALHNNEHLNVAIAIKEHYQPKFAGDNVPTSKVSSAVALADKLDTLTGIFGINQAPTGEKDPFALRRAAVGVLRILIENHLALDLKELLIKAAQNYHQLENKNVVEETFLFIMERLRALYAEQNISSDVYAAVSARIPTSPFDFDRRIKAIQYFQQLPEAQSLAAANKRVSNILKQIELPISTYYRDELIQHDAEKQLAELINLEQAKVSDFCKQYDYRSALSSLAKLKQPVDKFFDDVMVMVDDIDVRNNRLILLNNLRQLFLQIADISLLS